MPTHKLDRRKFLSTSRQSALELGLGLTILADSRSALGTPANDRVSLAMIGVRNRGNFLANGFLDRDDCEIAYVCDVDSSTGERRCGEYRERQAGKRVKFIQDYRDLLQESSIDAVAIATPAHWHAPMTVFSCQAGKDVYVEKPPTHNPWEGQQMVKAARKYNRVVQIGTQNRSAPYNIQARQFIADGGLGKVHLCRVFNMKGQSNFTLPPNGTAPEGFSWDIWNGPAPDRPYNEGVHRSGWHHLWDYSGGDVTNDSVHQLDLARMLIGVDTPNAVHCSGGRFNSSGDAQTPDTQIATYEFDDLLMTFEMTLFTPYMLKTDSVVRDTDMFPYWPQNATRIEIYGDEAVMTIGRMGGGWQVHVRTKDRKPVVKQQSYGRFPDPEHKENFLQCLRSRKPTNASPLEGHRSIMLAHYANISYRTGGQKLRIDTTTEQFINNPEAMKLFRREYREPYAIPDEV